MEAGTNRIRLKSVDGNPDSFSGSYVRSVSYGEDGLDIIVKDSPVDSSLAIKVHFSLTYGFRVLDEGDLNDFWCGEWDGAAGGIVIQVLSGGWFDQEKSRQGFIGGYAGWVREYLITGQDACVSVLAGKPPVIEVIQLDA